jgi:hypothetical protein
VRAAVFAAIASLGPSTGAVAGAILGTVAFPSRLVPSMTVYISDVDTSRLHSVQLVRGQASFTIDVPRGRYVVFSAPNEPGAPGIYGAYTQYSLCAPHADGRCEDHALVPVAVTAKAPRAAVIIDDWYLTDDVAQQIDHLRGVTAGGLDAEPLSAPRFSEYPSTWFDASASPKLDFGGSDLSAEGRASVQQAISSGPNFAGHVTAILSPCGPACGRLVLVDWISGAIQGLPAQGPGAVQGLAAPTAEIQGMLPCRPEEALLVRRDSRLLSISRMRGTAVITQYYVWNQKNAALIPSGEYQRPAQTFCAVAAR